MSSIADGIAIIGMAGRFPGAHNLEQFWRNLCDGIESIVRFDDDGPSDPNYVKAAARLDDVEWFDAAFFGYPAKEAAIMDPQHRLFLECAWEALEDAGYARGTSPAPSACIAGRGANSYLARIRSPVGKSRRGRARHVFSATRRLSDHARVVQAESDGPEPEHSDGVLHVAGGGTPGLPEPAGAASATWRSRAASSISVPERPGYFYQDGRHRVARRALPRVRRARAGDGLRRAASASSC